MGKKKQKIRAAFRKNRSTKARKGNLTRRFQTEDAKDDESVRSERISGKGELTRKRTIVGEEDADTDTGMQLEVDAAVCLSGRVLNVNGLLSTVETEDGTLHQCATRRLLKTLSTDQRHVVVAGDIVSFRPANAGEGIIERVEPRHGVLSRASRGRQHVIVANVDQLLIIGSAAEPDLKPNLIDRMLVTAERARIRPVICINKVDLIDPADLQPLIGVYGQMGYQVLLTSAETGQGIDSLRQLLHDCESVVSGQSGVGKSSLLNSIQPELGLRVSTVSRENQKGRHTTTTAQLIPLLGGGYVVDTPGIRQFQLWDVIPEEVGGYYRDIRPYVDRCRFANCTHMHESECAVKDAVADGRVDARRYESYCHLFADDMA